ncbi:unnamed protein product [Calypogeia fissa]
MHGRTYERTLARTFLDCTGGAEVGSCFDNRTRLAQTRDGGVAVIVVMVFCSLPEVPREDVRTQEGLSVTVCLCGRTRLDSISFPAFRDIRLPVVEGRLDDSFVNGEVVASRCLALRLDGGKGAAERMMICREAIWGTICGEFRKSVPDN